MGKPVAAQIKASSDAKVASSSSTTAPPPASSSKGKAPAQDNNQGELLAKLMEQVKAQEAQIAALKSSF